MRARSLRFAVTLMPNEVLLLLEWDDLERARLFADSDDLREAMTRAGVTDRPDIWFLEDVGHRPA